MSNTEIIDLSEDIIPYYIPRLAAALYRVTEYLSDEDPLKWSLRKNALRLVDILSGGTRDNTIQNFQAAFNIASLLLRELTIMQQSGFVYRINFDVLIREYSRLAEALTRFINNSEDSEKNILDISTILKTSGFKKSFTEKNMSNRSIKDKSSIASSRKNSMLLSSSTNERQGRLLDCLHQQSTWLSLMDIAALLGEHGMSTKTIQRDLALLTFRGLVQSKGERRWKRYMLVKGTA